MANLMTVSTEDDAVGVDILPALEYEITERRRLHRVPRHIRENKKHLYDPMVLSLGPYHHGQLGFPSMDELKEEVYSYMLQSIGGNKVMDMFRQRIREKIDYMRNFYRGVSEDKYGDEAWTEIMVRDTCFVLYCMEMATGDCDKEDKVLHHLGLSGFTIMLRNLFLLDNQIPLRVIMLLISLKYADNKGEELLYKFFNKVNFGDDRLKQLPWKDNQVPPLHLLEARRAALVKEENSTAIGGLKSKGRKRSETNSTVFELANSPFRYVTDLKAKYIHFRPSSHSLRDIKFNSYGTLQLPMLLLTSNTKKPEDVKKLREKGILSSRMGNDEEMVNIFKEIDAYAIDPNDFLGVKMRINKHCNSEAKTWMAELIHSKIS